MLLEDSAGRMDYIYNAITGIFNENESTVIVTWDTLHILMTLLIFIALIILIWVAKLNPCDKEKHEGKYRVISADNRVPRCIDADNSLFA